MKLGENVKALRTLSGLTQTQLAEKTGSSERMIKFIEKGQKIPSLNLAIEMALALNCSLDTLTGFKIRKEN